MEEIQVLGGLQYSFVYLITEYIAISWDSLFFGHNTKIFACLVHWYRHKSVMEVRNVFNNFWLFSVLENGKVLGRCDNISFTSFVMIS